MSTSKNGQIRYIAFLIKLLNGLELVFRLQHRAKNMIEMFVIQRTSI